MKANQFCVSHRRSPRSSSFRGGRASSASEPERQEGWLQNFHTSVSWIAELPKGLRFTIITLNRKFPRRSFVRQEIRWKLTSQWCNRRILLKCARFARSFAKAALDRKRRRRKRTLQLTELNSHFALSMLVNRVKPSDLSQSSKKCLLDPRRALQCQATP